MNFNQAVVFPSKRFWGLYVRCNARYAVAEQSCASAVMVQGSLQVGSLSVCFRFFKTLATVLF